MDKEELKDKICSELGGTRKGNICFVGKFPLDLSSSLFYFKAPEYYKVVSINPEKFLKIAPQIELDRPTIEGIKKSIRNKRPIEPLFFDISEETGKILGHEGRHRAKASLELGIDKVPVILYCRGKYGFVPFERCSKVSMFF